MDEICRPMAYLLHGRVVVPVPMRDWTLQPIAVRRVAEDRVGNVWVSTVFLGLDHGWVEGRPILFETMVFAVDDEDGADLHQERYATWDEAAAGHARIVAGLRSSVATEARDGDADG